MKKHPVLTDFQFDALRIVSERGGITPACLGWALADAGAIKTKRSMSAQGAAMIAGKATHHLLERRLIRHDISRGVHTTTAGDELLAATKEPTK